MRKTLFLALVLAATTAFALPPDSVDHLRHFILEPQHALQADEIADLQAKGVTIGRAVGANRFIARVADEATVAGDLRIRSLEAYDWSHKIAGSAYAEAAKGKTFARLRVVFHDEVGLDEARRAIAEAGAGAESPLSVDWQLPNTLVARVPAAEVQRLAFDERVFGLYGPPLNVKTNNAVAAGLSHVTPLFSAPYNLGGDGIVLSHFELGPGEASHLQFQGRYDTSHVPDCGSGSACASNKLHATHTAGTLISAGIDDARDSRAPQSKGMAPKAHLFEFNVIDDFANVVAAKDTQLKALGVSADSNSWDFTLGWSFESPSWVWNGDFFGAYDPTYSSPYEAVTVKSGEPLFVHSAGNDASQGSPTLTSPFSPHLHCCDENGATIKNETFCYSPSGSGNDCGAPCTAGTSSVTNEKHCEATHHATVGPFRTIGLEASLKNVVSVGAMDAFGLIGEFSSRGPTMDGRLKPELVAKGLFQLSTITGGSYATRQGTSMSCPVVAGIAGLLTEQWRKTFSGQNPSGVVLKTLLIAGADDQIGPSNLDLPGPDYIYGFGLADAQKSVDLIIADATTGARIRTGTMRNGDTVEFPLAVSSAQDVRVVLGWFDPEIFPPPDAPETPTLLNDLDLKVIDPNGATVLPYVLDKDNPGAAATRGVNTVDTTEMVEIKNAAAGQYRVIVTAKLGNTTAHPTQDFALVANAALSPAAPACGDAFEPNNSQAVAFKYLPTGQTIAARTCSASDVDFYEILVGKLGPLAVTVAATDTPLRVTLSGNGLTAIVVDVPVQSSRTLNATAAVGVYDVQVQPNGTVGAGNAYTLTPTFSNPPAPKRHRSAGH
jgi:hypothetical protein